MKKMMTTSRLSHLPPVGFPMVSSAGRDPQSLSIIWSNTDGVSSVYRATENSLSVFSRNRRQCLAEGRSVFPDFVPRILICPPKLFLYQL